MSIRVNIIDGAAQSGLKTAGFISRIINVFNRNLKISSSQIILGVAVLLLVNIAVIKFSNLPVKPSETVVPYAETEEENCLPELNDRNLFAVLKEKGVICEMEVMAQAKLESGNYRSVVFRRANNMFGMRYPMKRETKAIGIFLQGKGDIILGTKEELKPYLDQPNYAVYANWMDCVEDYKIWQDYSFKTREKYLAFLNGMYAEDSLYISRIRHISDKTGKYLAEN